MSDMYTNISNIGNIYKYFKYPKYIQIFQISEMFVNISNIGNVYKWIIVLYIPLRFLDASSHPINANLSRFNTANTAVHTSAACF